MNSHFQVLLDFLNFICVCALTGDFKHMHMFPSKQLHHSSNQMSPSITLSISQSVFQSSLTRFLVPVHSEEKPQQNMMKIVCSD